MCAAARTAECCASTPATVAFASDCLHNAFPCFSLSRPSALALAFLSSSRPPAPPPALGTPLNASPSGHVSCCHVRLPPGTANSELRTGQTGPMFSGVTIVLSAHGQTCSLRGQVWQPQPPCLHRCLATSAVTAGSHAVLFKPPPPQCGSVGTPLATSPILIWELSFVELQVVQHAATRATDRGPGCPGQPTPPPKRGWRELHLFHRLMPPRPPAGAAPLQAGSLAGQLAAQ